MRDEFEAIGLTIYHRYHRRRGNGAEQLWQQTRQFGSSLVDCACLSLPDPVCPIKNLRDYFRAAIATLNGTYNGIFCHSKVKYI
jgi:hypothetical protein